MGYFVLLQPWWRARSRIILRLSASGNYDAGILGVARTRAALYSRASGIALVAREFGQPAPHGPRLPDRVGVALRAGNNPQPRPRRLAALQRVAAIIALRGGIRGPVYFGLRVTGGVSRVKQAAKAVWGAGSRLPISSSRGSPCSWSSLLVCTGRTSSSPT